MRGVLSDYNDLLANTHIDIYHLEKSVIKIGKSKKLMRLQINQQDKFVRRIFNNSRWDQGGRFYGGWWDQDTQSTRIGDHASRKLFGISNLMHTSDDDGANGHYGRRRWPRKGSKHHTGKYHPLWPNRRRSDPQSRLKSGRSVWPHRPST